MVKTKVWYVFPKRDETTRRALLKILENILRPTIFQVRLLSFNHITVYDVVLTFDFDGLF